MPDDHAALLARIAELEAENARLRAGVFTARGPTVGKPPAFVGAFARAEEIVARHFAAFRANPTEGTIDIDGERYVLVRAAGLSTDFVDTFQALYADRGEDEALRIGHNFLFDIAHVLGRSDASRFHDMTEVTDPVERLSTGPVHFAYAGWAFVEILPASRPVPDDDFLLVYRHPYSFEADAWLRAGRTSTTTACIMNAGYSSGWCEQSFGMALTAVEVTCRARGDEHCEFIMAPPHRVAAHLASRAMGPTRRAPRSSIPTFFERKEVEERLRGAVAETRRLLADLRTSERTLRAVLDSVDDAILQIDIDGHVVQANQRTFELYGMTHRTMQGDHFVDEVARTPHLAAAWDKAVRGEPQMHTIVQHRHSDETPFDAEILMRRVVMGDRAFVIANVRDVTEQRKVERLKDEFVSMVSHELRTPLTSVYAALGLALKPGQAVGEHTRPALEIALRNCKRLIHILGDILDLERLSAGRLELVAGAADLSALAQESIATNQGYAASFGVTLAFEGADEVTAWIDAQRLLQVLDNLLSNAAKFSEPGQAVTMRVHAGGDHAIVEVQDRGHGIPEDFRARVFEPFAQADASTNRERYGTGLGLAICKRLVEAMGGTIQFDSEEGVGTTFRLRLPAHPSDGDQ